MHSFTDNSCYVIHCPYFLAWQKILLLWWILKTSDDEEQHIELLAFWTFSIVQYSREQKHDVLETGSVFVLMWKGEKTHTLLGPLERVNLNHRTISQSQSHIATDGQSISKSWCRALSGAHDQIFITLWQLGSCFCGARSLTRGRVCLLYMLALASAVFLGSESLGSRDHILLSQFWDFPLRRFLRFAESRWKYSTPSPHGSNNLSQIHPAF
jgi:hypothetical protein